MCWEEMRDFPCVETAPGLARHFCTKRMGNVLDRGPALTDVLGDLEVIVSELVTNAVRADCGHIELHLVVHRDRIRLTVHDDAPGHPRIVTPAPDEGRGRGLGIVEAIATDWGVAREPAGKAVWAELAIPAVLTTSLRCG